MAARERWEWKRLAVFIVVGCVNTAVCYAFYALLVWLGWHYNRALAADYALGALVGYALHRGATFADRTHVRAGLGKYTVTLAVTFAANLVLLDWLVTRGWLAPLAGGAVAMTAASLVGYHLQARWVFRSHERAGDAVASCARRRRRAA